MRPNALKTKLQNGEAVVGAFCNIPSPATVEILGWLGFDFAILDAEHSPVTLETLENMIRGAEVSNVTPLARIGVNLQENILRYLDSGCMGVQMPLINDAQQAQSVVEWVKYPPAGKRGLAGVRTNTFGVAQSLTDYVHMANQETLVIVQVETTEAMDNLDKILAVDGVDGVFLGPSDLSSSMGYPGQPTHPEVVKAITEMGQRIVKAGKFAGTIARNPQAFADWRKVGFQYLATGTSAFLAEAARNYIEGCRKATQ